MYKRNVAKCTICGDVIESKNVHDFVTCSCGNLSVDGGMQYIKRSVIDLEKYEELSKEIDILNQKFIVKSIKQLNDLDLEKYNLILNKEFVFCFVPKVNDRMFMEFSFDNGFSFIFSTRKLIAMNWETLTFKTDACIFYFEYVD